MVKPSPDVRESLPSLILCGMGNSTNKVFFFFSYKGSPEAEQKKPEEKQKTSYQAY